MEKTWERLTYTINIVSVPVGLILVYASLSGHLESIHSNASTYVLAFVSIMWALLSFMHFIKRIELKKTRQQLARANRDIEQLAEANTMRPARTEELTEKLEEEICG